MIIYILRNLKNWLEIIYNGGMKCFFFYLYSAIVIDIIIIVNGMFKIFDYICINNVFFVISISIFDVY